MIIYPAIELHNGRCVNPLKHHDQGKEGHGQENATDKPAKIALHWENQGAEWLHVVNLDGSLEVSQLQIDAMHQNSSILIQMPGEEKPLDRRTATLQGLPPNLRTLYEICKVVDVPVQFSGGLYTLADIEMAFKLGANRVVLDVVAIQNLELVRMAVEMWGGDRIVAGVEARRSHVLLNGSAASTNEHVDESVSAIEVGHHIHALGITRMIYTEVAPGGTLGTLHMEETSRLGDTTDLRVMVHGQLDGMQSLERLKAFEHYNIEGVILGQSLYAGAIELPRAIEIGHQPLSRRSAGIVPFRNGVDGPEFLLLFNLFFEQWQFPRGGVESGESDLHCAQREFAKETGMKLKRLFPDCRTKLSYTASIRGYEIDRTVIYFLAEVEPGAVRLGHENHCEARWLSPKAAWELLTETAPEQIPALDAAVAYLHGHRPT